MTDGVGGVDVVVEGRPSRRSIVDLIRIVRRSWPDAVVEQVTDSEESTYRIDDYTPTGSMHELVFYRDLPTKRSWEADGLTPDNADGVVHCTMEHDAICFVVDSVHSPSGEIVGAFRQAAEQAAHYSSSLRDFDRPIPALPRMSL